MQTCNFCLGSTWTQNLNQAGEVQGGAGDELEVICKGILLEPARPSTKFLVLDVHRFFILLLRFFRVTISRPTSTNSDELGSSPTSQASNTE